MSQTYIDLSKKEKAKPYLKELLTRYPSTKHALAARLNLADIYFTGRQYKNAIPQYLKIASFKKSAGIQTRSYALYKLAWAYHNLGQYDKALRSFKMTAEFSKKLGGKKSTVFLREAYQDLAMAFPLAGKYREGQKYFYKVRNKALLKQFRMNSAQIAREKGDLKMADYFYDRVIKSDPMGADARDISIQRLSVLSGQKKWSEYALSFSKLFYNYGKKSKWMRKQKMNEEQKNASSQELVDMLRRETKFVHKLAQSGRASFLDAKPMYGSYFRYVPKPNPESAVNLHEMKFYNAELLYQLKDYKKAAEYYAKVGSGKYAATAAYNQILALREASKSDKTVSSELLAVTNNFVKLYPQDNRAVDLLYASAANAFDAGNSKESLVTLRSIVKNYPNSSKGVSAAERILFLHEKEKNVDLLVKESNSFLANKSLIKAGGNSFQAKLKKINETARFKKIESLAENVPADYVVKAKSFELFAPNARSDLKKKSYNNALVYFEKAKSESDIERVQAVLLRKYPKDKITQRAYLDRAQKSLKKLNLADAKNYFLKYTDLYPKRGSEHEAAMANWLLIQSHEEDIVLVRFPDNKAASTKYQKKASQFLKIYPKSSQREFVLSTLANQKSAKIKRQLKSLPRLRSSEKAKLFEADILAQYRKKQYTALLKKNRPSSKHSFWVKKSLAKAALNLAKGKNKSYTAIKLSKKSPALFVKGLSRKIKSLESLEKEYSKVPKYGDGETALESLLQLSSLYSELGSSIKSYPEAAKELSSFIVSFEAKSLSFLQNCIDKAREFRITALVLNQCKKRWNEKSAKKNEAYSINVKPPQWSFILTEKSSYTVMARDAYAKSHWGRFSLAKKLAERDSVLNEEHKAYFRHLTAMFDYRLGRPAAAEKEWKSLFQLASLRPAYKKVVLKNLSALQLKVGDYTEVAKNLSEWADMDADLEEMKRVAILGANVSKEGAK